MEENKDGYLSHEFLSSVRKNLEACPIVQIIPFKYDKGKVGWKLLFEGTQCSGDFIPEIKEFMTSAEARLNGEEMMRRAKKLDAHGQHDAEYLMEHQERIPVEVRDYYLVFPETVWWDEGASAMMVPCLRYQDSQWYLGYRWIGDTWLDNVRFVGSREELAEQAS